MCCGFPLTEASSTLLRQLLHSARSDEQATLLQLLEDRPLAADITDDQIGMLGNRLLLQLGRQLVEGVTHLALLMGTHALLDEPGVARTGAEGA